MRRLARKSCVWGTGSVVGGLAILNQTRPLPNAVYWLCQIPRACVPLLPPPAFVSGLFDARVNRRLVLHCQILDILPTMMKFILQILRHSYIFVGSNFSPIYFSLIYYWIITRLWIFTHFCTMFRISKETTTSYVNRYFMHREEIEKCKL